MNHHDHHYHITKRGIERLYNVLRAVKRKIIQDNLAYRRIQPTMISEQDEICDVNDVILQENSDIETQCKSKLSKKPRRVLQFSDGVMEEYSSEDEIDPPRDNKLIARMDMKHSGWLPWAWYQTTWFSSKMLDGCDYIGERLASFFGITAPKYQFEINEFYRLQALEKEMLHKQDLEMGGWNERKKNSFIDAADALSVEDRS